LLGVIGDISERYEDLGFSLIFCSKSKIYEHELHYQPNPGEEIVYILPYRFRPKLIIFQVIDSLDPLKERGIDALIMRRRTKKRHFILALQKILFDMDSAILPILLQQELDEIVLNLGGISSKDRSIIQSQQERARGIVQGALRKHLDLKPYTKRQRSGGRRKKSPPPSNPGKEILRALIINYKGDLKEMAEGPSINTDVAILRSWIKEEGLEGFVKEQTQSWIREEDLESLVGGQKKKQPRGGGRKEKKYHHPGKEILKQLIEEYNAKLSDMAKDPRVNASQPTLSVWINKDAELRRLAREQRWKRKSQKR